MERVELNKGITKKARGWDLEKLDLKKKKKNASMEEIKIKGQGKGAFLNSLLSVFYVVLI